MAQVKTINLTGPNDYQVQQQNLDRQRKLAELLQQQSMAPTEGQMVSGWYVPPSPLQGLSKIAQALAGKHQQEQLDQKQTELTKQSNDALVAGIQNYQRDLAGTPATSTQIVDDEYGPQTVNAPAVAGDRQKALANLLASNHPTLQQLGMAQLLQKPEQEKWSTTPQYDQNGNAFLVSEQGNRKPLDGVKSRDKLENVNGVWVNPYQQVGGAVAPADPNKPFSIGPDGKPVANTEYQKYEIGKAKAGKTDVNVKTELKMNEGLASQVGPMMKDSSAAAAGAVQQVDAAQRIVQAVDTGKLIAGPGASSKLKLMQIGTAIGIGGKDEAEKIANTRHAIRGLAELTLQGRKSMSGQGAITESEGALAERAYSGDIDSLTPAEIKIIAKASERTARFQHAEHQRKIEQMRKTPGLDGITPFYEVPAMPAPMNAAPPSGSATGGWSIRQK